MNPVLIEIIGYAGTTLVAISLAMQNVRYLRWINLIGTVCFAIYGILLNIVPVIVANSFIFLAHVYYLSRMMLNQEHFLIVPVTAVTSAFLPKFLQFYKSDLLRQFPRFNIDEIEHWRHVFIARDMRPVGLFSYEYRDNQEVLIHLDYVIPTFRDYKTARFLFDEFDHMLAEKGFKGYTTYSYSKLYRRYLLRMGFSQDPENEHKFTKGI